MRKNPGRKERRERTGIKKKGNLNQNSKHKMRTTDGMIDHAGKERKQELLARRGGHNPSLRKEKQLR